MKKKRSLLLIAFVVGTVVGFTLNIDLCYGFKISIYDEENNKWYYLMAMAHMDH